MCYNCISSSKNCPFDLDCNIKGTCHGTLISSTIENITNCQQNCLKDQKCLWHSYNSKTGNCLTFSDCFKIKSDLSPGFISSHFSCAPNISGFEDAKIMKQIHSTIDWTPFVYKKTRITPYCHDFCKIDFNCEFFMSLDGFCMLGKFSQNSKIILSHQLSLMSILRTKSKWFCKKKLT